MEVAIPHNLGRETVRHRLQTRSHKIAEHIPGGMAQVTTAWPSEDRMELNITTMGQTLQGRIDIEDEQIIMAMALPPAIAFLRPMIEGALRQQGQKLLGPSADDSAN
jgi:hypothetical protein